MFENILVVCVGNICRSPMAEALLTNRLIKKNNTKFIISSAGLNAMVGHNPDTIAIQLMLEKGLEISAFKARQIDRDMIRKSDLILTMESSHNKMIETNEPSAKGKVFRLGEWSGFDISDPYKQERKVFAEVLQQIEKGVTEWENKIL